MALALVVSATLALQWLLRRVAPEPAPINLAGIAIVSTVATTVAVTVTTVTFGWKRAKHR
jgi:hypothetical protein